jgi:hypothetical protein
MSTKLTSILKEIHGNFQSIELALKNNNIKIINFLEELLMYNFPRYSRYTVKTCMFSGAYKMLFRPIIDQLPIDTMVMIDDSTSSIKDAEDGDKELAIVFNIPVSFVRQIYTISIHKYLQIQGNIEDDCKKFVDILYGELSDYLINAYMNCQLDKSTRSQDLLWDNYRIALISIVRYYLEKNRLFLNSYLSEELKFISYEAVNH